MWTATGCSSLLVHSQSTEVLETCNDLSQDSPGISVEGPFLFWTSSALPLHCTISLPHWLYNGRLSSAQNPAASKRSLFHQREKNKSLQLCGNTKPLFPKFLMAGFAFFFFCFLWQKRAFKTPGERSWLCWGLKHQHGRGKIWFDSLLQMRQRTDLSPVFVTFPWPIQQQSKQRWNFAVQIPGSAQPRLKLWCGSQQQLISWSHSNWKVLLSKIQEKMLSTTTSPSRTKEKSS